MAKYLKRVREVDRVDVTGEFEEAFINFVINEVPFSVDCQFGALQFFCDQEDVNDKKAVVAFEALNDIVNTLREYPLRACFSSIFSLTRKKRSERS